MVVTVLPDLDGDKDATLDNSEAYAVYIGSIASYPRDTGTCSPNLQVNWSHSPLIDLQTRPLCHAGHENGGSYAPKLLRTSWISVHVNL